MSNGHSNWRNDHDDDGFPTPNEDRNGDLYTDEYGVTYYCTFIEGLGWLWKTFARSDE